MIFIVLKTYYYAINKINAAFVEIIKLKKTYKQMVWREWLTIALYSVNVHSLLYLTHLTHLFNLCVQEIKKWFI